VIFVMAAFSLPCYPIMKRSETRDLRGYIRYLGASICHRTPVPDCACAPVQPGHTSFFSEQKEGWSHVHAVRLTGVCRISDMHEYFFLAENSLRLNVLLYSKANDVAPTKKETLMRNVLKSRRCLTRLLFVFLPFLPTSEKLKKRPYLIRYGPFPILLLYSNGSREPE